MDDNDLENTFHLKVAKWCNNLKNFIENNWKDIVVLFFLFLIFLIFLKYLPLKYLPYYNPSEVNGNSLNIINLLVQIEAAIIAIVITLSLVAVQLTAQSYSTRIIGIFKRNNSFRAIVFLYVFIIVIGVITLILADNEIAEVTIKRLLLANYCIAIVAFISLIPFIKAMFNLLKPSTILEELSKDIKEKEKILNYLSDRKKYEDPIQPMVDIIHSSCIRNDYYSFKKGLNLIHDDLILSLVNKDKVNQQKILSYILEHYNSIAIVALDNNDEKYIIYVVMILFLVGEHCVSEKLKDNESDVVNILGNIGKITASKFENTTIEVVNYLKTIYIMVLEDYGDMPLRYVANFGYIGQIAIEQKFDFATERIIDFIEEVIEKLFDIDEELVSTAEKLFDIDKELFDSDEKLFEVTEDLFGENNNQNIINISLLSLRRIGKTALEQELDLVVESLIRLIKSVGKKSIKKYEMSAKMALSILEDICMITLNKRLESKVVSAIISFECIGEEAIDQKKEAIIEDVLVSFYRTGKVSLENDMENSIMAILESLGIIGNKLIQQNMDELALQEINFIQRLEEIAKKNPVKRVLKRIDDLYVNLLQTAKMKKVKKVINVLENRNTP